MTTLTYNPNQDQPEFSEDELNSIQVGEQMEAEQQQMLAGKFQDAEQLEQAYIELQKKLGQQPEEEEQVEEQVEEEQQEIDASLLDRLWEESQDEFSQELIDELKSKDPIDIAEMFLAYKANQSEAPEAQQLSDGDIDVLYNVVGGQEEYTNMLSWASDSLSSDEIDMYDGVMAQGDPAACFFAVQALAFRYAELNGWDNGDMLTGRESARTADAFRSQAEVVQAMNDPRYDRDPAYRQDVYEKLERSKQLVY